MRAKKMIFWPAVLASLAGLIAPTASADPLPDCVDGGFGPPADMVAPTGSAACVLLGPDGWSYQATWSQGAAQYLWEIAIRVVDPGGAVQQSVSEQVGGMSKPYGFKLWDLDQDGRPELVAHTDNGAQNGTWAVWRKTTADGLFRRAGEFGAVGVVEESGFFTAWWHMSAFEDTLTLYRFDQDGALVKVAFGDFAASRADPESHAVKCELAQAEDLAAAGLTKDQAQERLCRRNWS